MPCWFSTTTSLFCNYWKSGSHFVQREVIFTLRILVSSILPTMADTGTISHASISENVHSIVMYICTNFGAFIKKWTIGLVCRCTIATSGCNSNNRVNQWKSRTQTFLQFDWMVRFSLLQPDQDLGKLLYACKLQRFSKFLQHPVARVRTVPFIQSTCRIWILLSDWFTWLTLL